MLKKYTINSKVTGFIVVISAFLLLAIPIHAVLNSSPFLPAAQKFINDNCSKKKINNEVSVLCYLFFKTNELNTSLTNTQNTVSGLVTSGASQSAEIESLEQRIASLEAKSNSPTPTPSGCVQPPSGIISWWPGDGNATDIVGSNSGTLQGATFATGEVGQAFSFDGNTNYVQASTNGFPTGNSDRTLELWVKINAFLDDSPNPSDPLEAFFAGYGNYGSSGQIYHLGTAGNIVMFSQWGSALFGPSLQANTWYHIVVTNTGNSETLYLGGSAVATGTLTMNTPSGTSFYMGRIPGAIGDIRRLNGQVDEVTIYNRALSASEIKSIYDAGSSGKCK